MNTPHLLSPLTTSDGLELANRVVMAPKTRARAGESRIPTEVMATY
jgi:2,4-dienoyl-CoA reductase-like NADH-dependent reductase (Old Yellow Enzyme family)